ncbi:SEC14-like protein 1 [Amphiura filiformis]|uniref:SEC14-like protein 1 n=1 Tax=Amphiura filiformis TaxID=82378 RepID=UPI003B225DF1
MVQQYHSPVRVYKYPFELVMRAYEKRFPTCKMIPIFLGSETMSEYKSDDGAIHIVERRCKLNLDAPYLLKKITGVEFVYFIQKNSLNKRDRTLKIEAYNETFSTRVIVEEGCTYTVHPENSDWTCFEQTASLEVKSFFGFESNVEKMAVKHYAASIKKGKEIIMYYINELLSEGVPERLPRWTELNHDNPVANSTKDSRPALQHHKSSDSSSTLEQEPFVLSSSSPTNDTGSVEKLPDGAVGGCPSPPAVSATPAATNVEIAGSSSDVSSTPMVKNDLATTTPGFLNISPIPRSRLASSTMKERGKSSHPSKAQEVSKVDEDYIERFLGDLNPLQESRLIQLREWLNETNKGKMPKDQHLLRFLRARDFNTEKAHEMITSSLAWRKQHQVDKILSTWTPPDILLNYFPGAWHFSDREGRPVFIMRLGLVDVKGLIKAVGEEGILRHVLSINEEGLRRTEEATRRTGKPISSWTCIVDCEGLSMRHLWRPGVKALLRMIEVVEANYPETMGKLLIVRAPRIFPVVWTLVSPFIDENTREKFLIYGGKNHMDVGGLPDHIDPTYLPDFLGGECYTEIPEGGFVPKSCYRSHDDLLNPDELPLCSETVYKSAVLQKGLPNEVIVQITEKQQVLTWDFDVLRGDIQFALLYSRKLLPVHREPIGPSAMHGTTNTVVIDKSMTIGIDYRVVESALVCKAGESIQGSHVCQVPGYYILQWKYYSAHNSLTSVGKGSVVKPHHMQSHTHHHIKSKVMFYHEVLSSADFRGSMTSLQSCQSGFSSLSISTTSSKTSGHSQSSSQVSR